MRAVLPEVQLADLPQARKSYAQSEISAEVLNFSSFELPVRVDEDSDASKQLADEGQ